MFYANLKPSDWLKKHAEKILKEKDLVTSSVTILELELIAKRDFDEDFSNEVLMRLQGLKNLRILNLSEKVLVKAVELRKEYKLNIFDSVHMATAIVTKEDIISSDNMFDLVDGVKRKDPREF
tara:strand:- start:473 stop:841 length:369 start_codon:yes stop_codon:yes gene_type:complete